MTPRRFFVGRAVGLVVLLAVAVLGLVLFNTHREVPVSVLVDGAHVGFVHAIEPGGGAMEFDDAVMLTGAAAKQAAFVAGMCASATSSDCAPNDYYIQNTDTRDVRVPIDPGASVTMQTYGMAQSGKVQAQSISLEKFATLINAPSEHWNSLPYTITTAHGAVTKIEEIYVP